MPLPPHRWPCGPFGSPLGPRLRHFVFLNRSYLHTTFSFIKNTAERGEDRARGSACARVPARASVLEPPPGVPRRVQMCVRALMGPGQAPDRVGAARGADPRRVRRGRAGACGAARCGRVCARSRVRACTGVRVPPAGRRGNNARGAPPEGLLASFAAPCGTRAFSSPGPKCSSLRPRSRGVSFGFFPPAPEAVPIAGANEARPLGSAPEVIGLGSERSPHGGHCRCLAAVPTTFFFFCE